MIFPSYIFVLAFLEHVVEATDRLFQLVPVFVLIERVDHGLGPLGSLHRND